MVATQGKKKTKKVGPSQATQSWSWSLWRKPVLGANDGMHILAHALLPLLFFLIIIIILLLALTDQLQRGNLPLLLVYLDYCLDDE